MLRYTVEQRFRFGEPCAEWLLCQDGHEIANGIDPLRLQLIASILNITPEETVNRVRSQLLDGVAA